MIGEVVKVLGRYYTVERQGKRINCVLLGRLRHEKSLIIYSEPAAVGDVVDFELNDDGETGAIHAIHERRNAFTRKDRVKSKEDLIAANLDQIVVIQSFQTPRMNLRFVDRLYVRGLKEGISVHLCINKSDLADKEAQAYVRSYYRGCGLPFSAVSALTGKGIEDFRKAVRGRMSIFIGTSGVGKSSILNRLYPDLNLRTTDVSERTGKGRHTTTNVELVALPDGSRIIDTPGLREFGLMDIKPNELGGYFEEFREFSGLCRFSPCTHDHEPGCEVKKMVEKGKIFEGRYVSYINILQSLKEQNDSLYA